MLNTHRTLLTTLQSRQKSHDEKSHQDILAENMYVRLKHMSLHFYKYTLKAYDAKAELNTTTLKATLIDSIIICLASANSLKIYLDDFLEIKTLNISDLCKRLSCKQEHENIAYIFDGIFYSLLSHGAKMAKVMESTDHMEAGNPRVEMSKLIPALTIDLLKYIDPLDINLEQEIEKRFELIENSFIL
ncbi:MULTISPECIES: hypothetical protein [Pseudomonas]|uniref:hypothetical protein n=1 Tax=Pseudomonas TaxID=286 RepID=UPI001FF618E6|nr:hypothetical protein [Pseudomonas sp. YL2]